MSKEILGGCGTKDIHSHNESTNQHVLNENPGSEDLARFQKQQAVNLQIKEVMARELAAMELPDYMVNEILNIEDEPPF